jgi:SNF family Na+-dependent transporter
VGVGGIQVGQGDSDETEVCWVCSSALLSVGWAVDFTRIWAFYVWTRNGVGHGFVVPYLGCIFLMGFF